MASCTNMADEAGEGEAPGPAKVTSDESEAPAPKPTEVPTPVSTEAPTPKPTQAPTPTPLPAMSLTDAQQKEINIFLSNFAEQGFYWNTNFSVYDYEFDRLVHFAYIHTKVNAWEKMSVEMQGENSYYVMSLDRFNDVMKRFFGLEFTEQNVKDSYSGGQHEFFNNKKFYFEAADGEQYVEFAVADAMYELDGSYMVDFSVYEIRDFWEYDDYGVVLDEGYKMRPEKAANDSRLEKIGSGQAIVTPYKYNNRDSYHLEKYWVQSMR